MQWDDLQPATNGRYCDRCEKNIVDLTTKSDAELIAFFHKKKDKVCGRLLPHQLNREIAIPSVRTSWHWLLPLAIGAMVSSPAQASELKPMLEQGIQAGDVPLTSPKATTFAKQDKVTINGTVVDGETGKPIVGVKIKQKGFENVLALTDTAGKFKLEIAEVNLSVAYTFEMMGYKNVELPLTKDMVVKLPIYHFILGSITSVYNTEPLYVVYVGKKSCIVSASRFNEIKPTWIESVEVLKDAKATALYGSKAANGAIIVEIKKAYAGKFDFSGKE